MSEVKMFRPQLSTELKKFDGLDHIKALYKTSEWTNYRSRFLAVNPQCYVCREKATVVDHIKIHRGDVALFEKNDNHIPLCQKHHNKITGLFDRHAVQKLQEKLKWMAQQRMIQGLFHRVMVIPYRKP